MLVDNIFRDGTQIALTLAGIALIALLVSQAQGTATVIGAATTGYGNLLKVVTLQNGYGNFAN